ncbi:MAG: hypothetical protein HZC41_08275 [Chloroflexi bacterium]|nr:hypothetical protein [Chloroflexota bacterium]
MTTLAMSRPSRWPNPQRLLTGIQFLWALVAVTTLIVTVLLYLWPDELLGLYPFRDPAGRQAALELLLRFRSLGWVAAAGAGAVAVYLWDARRHAVALPAAAGSLPLTVNHLIAIEPSALVKRLLLVAVVMALVLWLLPLNDSLQDDEADKLLVSVGSWQNWTSNFFNTRVNILPITLARLVYLVTQTRQEWLLRLPVFLTFALPLLYLWAVPYRKRYGLVTSLLLLIFFGLHGVLGEYATKVQGYLPMLTFATLQFLLWTDMLRSSERGPTLAQGLLWIALTVSGFLSHNFALFFTVAQVAAAFVIDVGLRLSRGKRTSSALTTAYGLVALIILAALSALGLRTILDHLGTGQPTVISLSAFARQLATAMTGSAGFAAIIGLALYGAALVLVWRRARAQYRPELYLALVSIALLGAFYFLTTPRYFYARFLLWLPLVWLVLLGIATREVTAWLPGTTTRRAAIVGCAGLLAALLLPSQLNWQADRANAINMRTAAAAARDLASRYTAEGQSVGYLLVDSYGNYSHRMWFYLPEADVLSDRNRDAGEFAKLRRQMQREVWIVPAARNEFSDTYAWIPDAADEVVQAGNMGVYAVQNAAFDRHIKGQ